MWEAIKRKLTSRKFWAMFIVTLWWLVEGTVNSMWQELGWKIVAVVTSYILGEAAVDFISWLRKEG
jgi:hypothetical protein